ncbi:MAG: hypothetical protein Q8Q50_00395 [Methylobacter sp.]|nr:hypothetical protein [Methylobacter sp.]
MIDPKKLKSVIQKNAESAKEQLAGMRDEIQTIKDELHWLENAPLHVDDAIAAIKKLVGEKSDIQAINHFFYPRGLNGPNPLELEVGFAYDKSSIMIQSPTRISGSTITDVSDLICGLFPIETEKRLIAQARKAADGIQSGPLLSERPALKRDLEKRLRGIEIDEEELICTAEELGMIGFYRREDCNPEVVLMIEA